MNIRNPIVKQPLYMVRVAIGGVVGEVFLFIAEEVEFQLTIDFVYHLLLAFAGIWV